jgi:hypothetical protein
LPQDGLMKTKRTASGAGGWPVIDSHKFALYNKPAGL